ncbi:leucine-rich repeat domain-containing protein [Candidatus Bathycorpusculum sp.]|uniref:leucine-rich repeat domain-containing protein n=1 Tax=Candidatus Bathycorpusculum sp. TaxID=2994959 RepID=UPI002838D4D2|nr:leucine-rich repeat domain-containing protein [Candidatus Termitimicrobium sp.]
MIALYDQYHDSSNIKIRVLLIEREAKDIYTDDWGDKLHESVCNIGSTTNFSNIEDNFMKLKALKDEALSQLINDFAKNRYVNPVDTKLIIKTLKKIDSNLCRPLYALFLTDAQIHGDNLLNWDRSHALKYVCEREQKRIEEYIQKGLERGSVVPAVHKKIFDACERFIVTATLSGGLDCKRAEEIASEDWKYLDNVIANMYGKNDTLSLLSAVGIIPTEVDCASERIPPLEPDLIGEYYCILWVKNMLKNELETKNRELLENVLDRALKNDLRAAAIVRDRIMRDFPDELQNNGDKIFGTIKIPNGVTTIEEKTFHVCSHLIEIHIPSGVDTIKRHAFFGCTNLTEIHIPDSVTTIKERSFYWCRSLTEIHIPNNITTIENEAFGECEQLAIVHLPNKNINIAKNAFPKHTKICIIP